MAGSTTATSPPPTRATGRAAPAAGRSSTPTTGTVVWDAGNTFEQLAVAHRAAQRGPRRQEGRRAGGPRRRRVRRHPYAVRRLRAGQLRRRLRRRATPPSRVRQVCRPPTAPRAAARCRRAACSWSPVRPTTPSVNVRASVSALRPRAAAAPRRSRAGLRQDLGRRADRLGRARRAHRRPRQAGPALQRHRRGVRHRPASSRSTRDGTPAVITGALTVTRPADARSATTSRASRPPAGRLLARRGGREGRGQQAGPARRRRDDPAAVSLPADVAAGLGKQGLEGVTATTDRQGPRSSGSRCSASLSTDPAGMSGSAATTSGGQLELVRLPAGGTPRPRRLDGPLRDHGGRRHARGDRTGQAQRPGRHCQGDLHGDVPGRRRDGPADGAARRSSPSTCCRICAPTQRLDARRSWRA